MSASSDDKYLKLATENSDNINEQGLTVSRLPGSGEWTWLQPYVSGGEGDTLASNPLGTESPGDSVEPRLQSGPYTAIEGYLKFSNPAAMCRDTTKNEKSPS
ncbi:hypothetical protein RRF57_003562 [Xylaria bambusicola]|uniref:Uncharacterized protein n=1 Tax=Xylaria bambusicola TaxID=326684 RepID=A0AAN7Z3J8_9PEZI